MSYVYDKKISFKYTFLVEILRLQVQPKISKIKKKRKIQNFVGFDFLTVLWLNSILIIYSCSPWSGASPNMFFFILSQSSKNFPIYTLKITTFSKSAHRNSEKQHYRIKWLNGFCRGTCCLSNFVFRISVHFEMMKIL